MIPSVIPRGEYAALEHGIYLNQASLGLIPRRSMQVMVEFLTEIAQQLELSKPTIKHHLALLRAAGFRG